MVLAVGLDEVEAREQVVDRLGDAVQVFSCDCRTDEEGKEHNKEHKVKNGKSNDTSSSQL